MEKTHPALSLFPNDGCTTPQWWKIVTDTRIAVLDELEIWLYNSLLSYMQSDAFAPKGEIAEKWLAGNYIK